MTSSHKLQSTTWSQTVSFLCWIKSKLPKWSLFIVPPYHLFSTWTKVRVGHSTAHKRSIDSKFLHKKTGSLQRLASPFVGPSSTQWYPLLLHFPALLQPCWPPYCFWNGPIMSRPQTFALAVASAQEAPHPLPVWPFPLPPLQMLKCHLAL